MDFTTKVATSVAQTAGTTVTVSNVANVFTSAATITSGAADLTSDAVVTKWAPLSFTKKGAQKSGTATALAGAEFKLFLSEAKAETGLEADAIRGATAANSADATGAVKIDGLRVSNWANGAAVSPGKWENDACAANPEYLTYWLTETKAPTGYELLAKPLQVAIENTSGTDTTLLQVTNSALIRDGESGPTCKFTETQPLTTITNVQANAGFKLPLTGG